MIREFIYLGLIIGCCYYQGLFDFSGKEVVPLAEYGEARIIRKSTTEQRFKKWINQDGDVRMNLKEALNEYYDFLGDRTPFEDFSKRKSKELLTRLLNKKQDEKDMPRTTPKERFDPFKEEITRLSHIDDPVYKKFVELKDAGNLTESNITQFLHEVSRRDTLRKMVEKFYEDLESLISKREDFVGVSEQFYQLYAESFKEKEELGRNLLRAYHLLPKDSTYVQIRRSLLLVNKDKVFKPYKRHSELMELERRERLHMERVSAFKAHARNKGVDMTAAHRILNNEYHLLTNLREEHFERINQGLNMEKFKQLWDELLEHRQDFTGSEIEFEFQYGVEIRTTEVLCKEMTHRFERIARLKAERRQFEPKKVDSPDDDEIQEETQTRPKDVVKFRTSLGHAFLENDLIFPMIPFYKSQFHFGKLEYSENNDFEEEHIDISTYLEKVTKQYQEYIGNDYDDQKMMVRVDELRDIYEYNMIELTKAMSEQQVYLEYTTDIEESGFPDFDYNGFNQFNLYKHQISEDIPLSLQMSINRIKREVNEDQLDIESELHDDFNPVYQKLDSLKNKVISIGTGLRESVYNIYKMVKGNNHDKESHKEIEEKVYKTLNPLQQQVDQVTQSLVSLGTKLTEKVYNAFEIFQRGPIHTVDAYNNSRLMGNGSDFYVGSDNKSMSENERNEITTNRTLAEKHGIDRKIENLDYHHQRSINNDRAIADRLSKDEEETREGPLYIEDGLGNVILYENHKSKKSKQKTEPSDIRKIDTPGNEKNMESQNTKGSHSFGDDKNIELAAKVTDEAEDNNTLDGKDLPEYDPLTDSFSQPHEGYQSDKYDQTTQDDNMLSQENQFHHTNSKENNIHNEVPQFEDAKLAEVMGAETEEIDHGNFKQEDIIENSPSERIRSEHADSRQNNTTHFEDAEHDEDSGVEIEQTDHGIPRRDKTAVDPHYFAEDPNSKYNQPDYKGEKRVTAPDFDDDKVVGNIEIIRNGSNKTKLSPGVEKMRKQWQTRWNVLNKLKSKYHKKMARQKNQERQSSASTSSDIPSTTAIPEGRNQIIQPHKDENQPNAYSQVNNENVDTEISDNLNPEDDEDLAEDSVPLDFKRFESADRLGKEQSKKIQELANEWTVERSKMQNRAQKKHGKHTGEKPIVHTDHIGNPVSQNGNPGLIDDPNVFDYQYDNALDDLDKLENNHGDIDENFVDTSIDGSATYNRKTDVPEHDEVIPEMTTEDEQELKYLERLRDTLLEKKYADETEKLRREKRSYENEEDDKFNDDGILKSHGDSDEAIDKNIESIEVFKDTYIDHSLLPEPFEEEFDYLIENEEDDEEENEEKFFNVYH